MDVSDKVIEIDGDNLTSSAQAYVSRINGLNLDTIDLSSFDALKEFGIASNFGTELKDALTKLKSGSMELGNMIVAMIEQHKGLDQAQLSDFRANTRSAGGGNSGGSSGGTTGGVIPEEQEPTIGGGEATIFSEDLNSKFNNEIGKLKYDNFKSLFATLLIESNNITELLTLENNATKIKEMLLKDNNIPKELKEIVLQLKDNEVQKQLLDYLTNMKIEGSFGDLIEKNIDIKTRSVTLTKIYKDIDKFDSADELLSIYDGRSDVSKETFDVTKVFLDSIANKKNVTVEVLLTDNQYKDFINSELQEFRKVMVLYNVKSKVVVSNE